MDLKKKENSPITVTLLLCKLMDDGHSPNLVISNYITKTENVHSKISQKKVIIQRHHQ
jgi:hypothetical protein